MTSGQKSFPVAPSIFKFKQHGQSGAWVSELLPHTAGIVDDITIIRSMQTEAINHDPAITFVQTGSQLAGRPSMGSWVSYGLGSLNEDLPSFVVLLSRGRTDQPLYDRLWGSGFLPSRYQGVKLRGGKDPVLYLANPAGCSAPTRRQMLDDIGALDDLHHAETGDPEILTRVAQYELAYRMQQSVPELTDLSREPQSIIDMYGPDVHRPGSYAANCLLARRLAERGVRFIQLYHMGWDQHGDLPNQIRQQCRDTDQASAALIKDLKQRGLLDDTLVIWGGEFGRTIYSQGQLTATNYGRDHHPRCFTIWMAGGGIKPGHVLRRDRRLLLQHRQGPGRSLRPERHDPAPPGDRAHPADLPLPGARLPTDRRARQGRPADPRLKQSDRTTTASGPAIPRAGRIEESAGLEGLRVCLQSG